MGVTAWKHLLWRQSESMGKKIEKLPAYHCRLCAKNAFPTEPGARPIPFPDDILRPTLSPEAVMHGVDAQLKPKAPKSPFICSGCFEKRVSTKALAGLRGRHRTYTADSTPWKVEDPAPEPGYLASCAVM